MAKKSTDKFANMAVIGCTESAANTLTFKKLETGISLFEKMAWIIHRVEYFYNVVTAAQFNADADSLVIALTTTDQLSSLAIYNNAIIDLAVLQRTDFGTPATGWLTHKPIYKDFSSLPGGGLIVPPNPLYLGAQGTSLAAASVTFARLFYTNYELSADEYWELVESRRLVSSI